MSGVGMHSEYDPALLGHIWDGPVDVCAITVFGHYFNVWSLLGHYLCVCVKVDDWTISVPLV